MHRIRDSSLGGLEAEHSTSRSRRPPTILSLTKYFGRHMRHKTCVTTRGVSIPCASMCRVVQCDAPSIVAESIAELQKLILVSVIRWNRFYLIGFQLCFFQKAIIPIDSKSWGVRCFRLITVNSRICNERRLHIYFLWSASSKRATLIQCWFNVGHIYFWWIR